MLMSKQEIIDKVEAFLKENQNDLFQTTKITTTAAGPEDGPYAIKVNIEHYPTGPDDPLAKWMLENGATR